MKQNRQRTAVIGAGISGMATAYFLNRRHDVVLFEAGAYLGGHTNTVDVTLEGMTHPVDTGFLVYNERTYPNLIALLSELNVGTIASDMSFGVSIDDGALEWAGTNLDSVFAQRSNLLSPRFLRMLRDILHFNSAAERNLCECSQSATTLQQLIQRSGYGALFRDAYLLPMAAAIWSSSPNDILKFPAATFLRFCMNHALLQVDDRPQWRTIDGGGRQYVNKIAATLPDVRLDTPIRRVTRTKEGVVVATDTASEVFDAVVFATHAPNTLQMLSDVSPTERTILSSVKYQPNIAYLHTDISQMPRRQKVWSAWNTLSGKRVDDRRPVCVTYWLNQLQNLPFKSPVMVTLNPFTIPAEGSIIAKFEYEHPVFDQAAITAQQCLAQIQGKHGVWFAGAWTGYGFHEDGLKSALRVVADFGLAPAWATL